MKTTENQFSENRGPGFIFWVLLGMLIALAIAFMPLPARAQKQAVAVLDTVICDVNCIQKCVSSATKSGNVTYKVVYIDRQNGVFDLIPISKSTYEYIQMCKEVGIPPQLGIKLKNGEINSVIKLKPKYRRVKT